MEDTSRQTGTFGFGPSDLLALLRGHRVAMTAVFASVIALAIVATLVMTPEYRAVTTLHLTVPAGQELGDEPVGEPRVTGQGRDEYFLTQLEIMASDGIAAEALARYAAAGFAADPVVPDVEALVDRTTITLRKRTELVDVSVAHPDPERAAILANLVAEAYLDTNLAGMRDAARDARSWLSEQLATYDARVEELDRQLVTYQQEQGLDGAELEVSAVEARVEELKGRLAAARADAAVLESRIAAHRELARHARPEEIAKHLDTPLVRLLDEQYAQAVATLAEVEARYGEKHPSRVMAQASVDRIRDEVAQEVARTIGGEEASLDVLHAAEARLEAEIAGAHTEMLRRQGLEDGYERLRAEAERSRAYLARLYQRRDDLDMVARTQLNNARVIAVAATPAEPFRPVLVLNLALATVFGVLAALAWALASEYLHDRLVAASDVQRWLGLPYLGQVPELPPEAVAMGALYTHEHPHGIVAEAVRGIRTLIELGLKERQGRRVLVTSSVASEGKTDTTARIAIALAQSGRRVLVVDADLRSPRQHRAFRFEQRGPGLVDLLAGGALDDVVRHTQVPGVDLVAAGAGGLEVKELLGSPRMDEVLAEAERRYDIVLLDTPPVVVTADPAILCQHVDGVVFIVRSSRAPRSVVMGALDTLRQVGAPLLGVVLNATSSRGNSAYAYYASRYVVADGADSRSAAK